MKTKDTKVSKKSKVIHIKDWPGGDRPSKRLLAGLNLIENPDDLHDYLKTSMGPLNREEFRVLYLNRSRHLISEAVLSRGTDDVYLSHEGTTRFLFSRLFTAN